MNYRLGAFGWLGGLLKRTAASPIWVFTIRGLLRDVVDLRSWPQCWSFVNFAPHHSSWWSRLHAPLRESYCTKPRYSNRVYEKYLEMTEAKDLDGPLTKDTTTLQGVNARMTFISSYGIFTFGPTVDDSMSPIYLASFLEIQRSCTMRA